MDEAMLKLKEWIDQSDNIVFFGGAGVSTESGIPDFRSEQGIYNTINKYKYRPEEILSHSFFISHTDIFYDFYKSTMLYEDAEPNAAHKALAKLEEMGKLKAIVTQNIDGLHQKAGSKVVYEVHGTVLKNYCRRCGESYNLDYIVHSEGVPKCEKCGGVVKPDVVLYEEGLDNMTVNASIRAISDADVLIIGGTSLNVYPAASFIQYYTGHKLVLINMSDTPYDDRADLLIHDSIGKVLGGIVNG